jgi:hypothetical protein
MQAPPPYLSINFTVIFKICIVSWQQFLLKMLSIAPSVLLSCRNFLSASLLRSQVRHPKYLFSHNCSINVLFNTDFSFWVAPHNWNAQKSNSLWSGLQIPHILPNPKLHYLILRSPIVLYSLAFIFEVGIILHVLTLIWSWCIILVIHILIRLLLYNYLCTVGLLRTASVV